MGAQKSRLQPIRLNFLLLSLLVETFIFCAQCTGAIY